MQIEAADLPRASEVRWQPLDASFRRQQTLVGLAASAIIAIALVTAQTIARMKLREQGIDFPTFWVWPMYLPLAVLLITWPRISVPKMGYAVRERDILHRAGVLWRRVTAIPYNRIQHVETGTSPLDRRFGLANLKIFTAGGAGGDLSIRGLSADVAEQLRVYLLDRIGTSVEQ
jgi:membrane protein YdbS with pleckstrin-like domain